MYTRLMLLMLAAALPAFAVIFYFAFWLHDHTEAEFQQQIALQAKQLAARHAAQIDQTRLLLASLANIPAIRHGRGAECSALLANIKANSPAYLDNLLVVQPNGDTLCSALRIDHVINVANMRWHQEGIKTAAFRIGEYHISRRTGAAVITPTLTIVQNGKVTGLLAASLDLSWLNANASAEDLPTGAVFGVFDSQGTILLRQPDPARYIGKNMGNTPLWHSMAKLNMASVFISRDMYGLPRLFAYAPLGPADHPYARLVIGVPEQIANADSLHLFLLSLGSLLVAVALGLITGGLGARHLVMRPLRRITMTVGLVTAGDLSARTGLSHNPSEISQLAGKVDAMAATLEERDHAVRHERDKAQSYLDLVGVMVVALDRDGHITLANHKTIEVLGLDEEGQDIVGCRFDQFLPPDLQVDTTALFRSVMSGEIEPLKYTENMLLTRTGERRLIAWHNTMLKDDNGHIIGTLSAGDDITELKATQQALRTNEAKYRTLLENIPIIIWQKNTLGVYVACNATFARARHLTPEQVEGKTDFDIYPPELAKQYWANDLRMFACGESEQYKTQWDDRGENRNLQVTKVPLRDGNGTITGTLGIAEDITERTHMQAEQERLQAQLQQAQKMEALGQLTGGIAHDFNNILASVLGFAKLALRRHTPDPDSELAGHLHEIISAGERATNLVSKMLAFGRTQPIRPAQPLSPLPMAAEAVKMLAATIPSSIRIETHFADDVPDIAIDSVAFHQILMNLVINARDAIGEKGLIDITLRSLQADNLECVACHQLFSGDYVELIVADSGEGISPKILPRIFEPFFTTKEVGKGSGMGLAMVHGLVSRASGHFQVDSKPGAGTTFHVYLPVASTHPTRPCAIPPPDASASSLPGRVLVVDDEPAILRLLDSALTDAGWQVSTFNAPSQALTAFRDDPNRFDAVITDQTMPELTGIELVAALRALRPELPIILCTGYSSGLTDAIARQAGINHFLRKPVDMDALVAALSETHSRTH
ncbi:MAG: PAS domain-containing protein [Parasulfuritortus sp.]|nr:PAS domain-containing protein [Parasulfuritortus sp.]